MSAPVCHSGRDRDRGWEGNDPLIATAISPCTLDSDLVGDRPEHRDGNVGRSESGLNVDTSRSNCVDTHLNADFCASCVDAEIE